MNSIVYVNSVVYVNNAVYPKHEPSALIPIVAEAQVEQLLIFWWLRILEKYKCGDKQMQKNRTQ